VYFKLLHYIRRVNIKPKDKLFTYNLIILMVIFVYFVFKRLASNSLESIIFWPGAYIIAIAIMSSFWIQSYKGKLYRRNSNKIIQKVLASVFYGIVILLLSDLLILILERFLRLYEHYTLSILLQKWAHDWYLLFEGVLIFWGYQLLISFDFLQKNFRLSERKILALENEIASSSLQSLRAELNPHFLYNAMNSIAMMVRVKKYGESIKMIANLNELLRISLSKSEEQLITLEAELNILDKYLQVELVRFGDRVQLYYDTNPDTMKAKVPQLILQPMVENAFKHGMSMDLGKQKISIKSERRMNQLVICLINSTKADISIDLSYRSGESKIGLQNVKNRLRQLYGGQFKFQFEQHAEEIEFRIIIPFQT